MPYKCSLLLLLLAAIFCTSAAKTEPDITGIYDTSTGDPQGGGALYVLPGHQFAMIFFGGAAIGTWQINGNIVNFKLQYQAAGFKVYGRHNKKLGNNIRMFFNWAGSNGEVMGFDQPAKPLMRKIFIGDPNCVAYPAVARFAHTPKVILFAARTIDRASRVKANAPWNIYSFNNSAQYNDFIADYNPESYSGQPMAFQGELRDGKLSFKQQTSAKKPFPQKGGEMEAIYRLVNTPVNPDKVFYNPYYNQVAADFEKDTLNYRFNVKKDAYIKFRNYVEGEENKRQKDGNYNSLHVVYQFLKLPLTKYSGPVKMGTKPPVFATKCKDQ